MLNDSFNDQNVPDCYQQYNIHSENYIFYKDIPAIEPHDDQKCVSPFKPVNNKNKQNHANSIDTIHDKKIVKSKTRRQPYDDYDLEYEKCQYQQKLNMKRYCEDSDLSNRSNKRSKSILTSLEMEQFFDLLENESTIKAFLEFDECCLIADKYALAMVFTYFKRAEFDFSEYTQENFFLALYLANDIEEDIDEYKYEIFPWALGREWRDDFQTFLKKRDLLLKKIDYRGIVSCKCCEEVMSMKPEHEIWKRTRSADHGGATRTYLIRRIDSEYLENEKYLENDILIPRGPSGIPRPCPLCILSDLSRLCKHKKPKV